MRKDLRPADLGDLAAKLNMDPLEFYDKNLGLTPRADVYRAQIKKGAELIYIRAQKDQTIAVENEPNARTPAASAAAITARTPSARRSGVAPAVPSDQAAGMSVIGVGSGSLVERGKVGVEPQEVPGGVGERHRIARFDVLAPDEREAGAAPTDANRPCTPTRQGQGRLERARLLVDHARRQVRNPVGGKRAPEVDGLAARPDQFELSRPASCHHLGRTTRSQSHSPVRAP